MHSASERNEAIFTFLIVGRGTTRQGDLEHKKISTQRPEWSLFNLSRISLPTCFTPCILSIVYMPGGIPLLKGWMHVHEVPGSCFVGVASIVFSPLRVRLLGRWLSSCPIDSHLSKEIILFFMSPYKLFWAGPIAYFALTFQILARVC